jgi:hypothetical protein
MLTGEIRSQIDSIWNDFWSGGVSNPLSVIEQLTYLLFIKRLDEQQTAEERKASQLKIPMERRIFPEGKDGVGKGGGRNYEDSAGRASSRSKRERCSRLWMSMSSRFCARSAPMARPLASI